jgi:hypothetical protein
MIELSEIHTNRINNIRTLTTKTYNTLFQNLFHKIRIVICILKKKINCYNDIHVLFLNKKILNFYGNK